MMMLLKDDGGGGGRHRKQLSPSCEFGNREGTRKEGGNLHGGFLSLEKQALQATFSGRVNENQSHCSSSRLRKAVDQTSCE